MSKLLIVLVIWLAPSVCLGLHCARHEIGRHRAHRHD